MRDLRVQHADLLFPTNDEWQKWRGDKERMDYLLKYPEFVDKQIELIETNDPSVTFEDEVDDNTNPLED